MRLKYDIPTQYKRDYIEISKRLQIETKPNHLTQQGDINERTTKKM